MNDKKVVFDELVYTEGLPCHKFILKSLTTINDAKTFTKNYINTMKVAGMDDDSIMNSLIFFSGIASGIEGRYDFTSWDKHTEGYSFIDNVYFDHDVALYRTCTQYYRKFDTKYTACDLCPLSKRYKNAKIEAEKNIIKYALSSRENLSYILEKGITEDCFCSVTDVTARKTISSKPCLYPFYKNTMIALRDDSICEEIFSLGEYEPILEKYHSKRIGRMSSISKDCSFSLNTFCAVMISEMLDGDVCSQDDLVQYLNALVPSPTPTSISPETVAQDFIIGSCNMGVDTINEFYNSEKGTHNEQSIKSTNANRQKLAPTSQNSPSEDRFIHITLDSILENIEHEKNASEQAEHVCNASENNIESVVVSIDAEEKAEKVLTWDTVKGLFSNTSVLDEIVENACGNDIEFPCNNSSTIELSYCNNQLISTSTNNYNTDGEDGTPIIITELPEDGLLSDKDNDLMAIPIVTAAELSQFALNLDSGNSLMLSLFESHTLKDKRLALEIVYEKDNGYYLLMYSPRLHAYFYTKCNNPVVNEILAPIMSQPSIEKFCYYPFAVIGVLRQLDITIKGLYSLYSMSSVLYKGHRNNMRMMLIILGATKAVGGITIRPTGEINSIALLYMHSYHTVFYRLHRQMLSDGLWNDFENANIFDMVLSLSYYQNIFSKECSTLFTLKSAGSYIFRNTVPTQFIYPGKCITLSFKHTPEQSSSLIVRLLCEMYDKGMFYKCGLMILSLGEDFVSLYIKDEHVEYVETRLNRLLLKYLFETKTRGLEFHLEEIEDGRIISQ